MENSPYAEAIVAARSLLLDPEEALLGNTTLSLETQEEFTEQDIKTYIEDNFPAFLKLLRYLSAQDQEMLLSYYALNKSQNLLANVMRTTQTLCSTAIRKALERLGMFILLGSLNEEMLAQIFKRINMEDKLKNVPLSTVVMEYEHSRSFQHVADMYELHRPLIRRTIRETMSKLNASDNARDRALAAYLEGLLDKASASGRGLSTRERAKQGHIYRSDPAILGEFRIDLQSPDFGHLFMPHGVN